MLPGPLMAPVGVRLMMAPLERFSVPVFVSTPGPASNNRELADPPAVVCGAVAMRTLLVPELKSLSVKVVSGATPLAPIVANVSGLMVLPGLAVGAEV